MKTYGFIKVQTIMTLSNMSEVFKVGSTFEKFLMSLPTQKIRNISFYRVEKSTNAVELKNKGISLYKKNFTSTDGYCHRKTGKIETQVWDNEGTLSTLSLQIGTNGIFNFMINKM